MLNKNINSKKNFKREILGLFFILSVFCKIECMESEEPPGNNLYQTVCERLNLIHPPVNNSEKLQGTLKQLGLKLYNSLSGIFSKIEKMPLDTIKEYTKKIHLIRREFTTIFEDSNSRTESFNEVKNNLSDITEDVVFAIENLIIQTYIENIKSMMDGKSVVNNGLRLNETIQEVELRQQIAEELKIDLNDIETIPRITEAITNKIMEMCKDTADNTAIEQQVLNMVDGLYNIICKLNVVTTETLEEKTAYIQLTKALFELTIAMTRKIRDGNLTRNIELCELANRLNKMIYNIANKTRKTEFNFGEEDADAKLNKMPEGPLELSETLTVKLLLESRNRRLLVITRIQEGLSKSTVAIVQQLATNDNINHIDQVITKMLSIYLEILKSTYTSMDNTDRLITEVITEDIVVKQAIQEKEKKEKKEEEDEDEKRLIDNIYEKIKKRYPNCELDSEIKRVLKIFISIRNTKEYIKIIRAIYQECVAISTFNEIETMILDIMKVVHAIKVQILHGQEDKLASKLEELERIIEKNLNTRDEVSKTIDDTITTATNNNQEENNQEEISRFRFIAQALADQERADARADKKPDIMNSNFSHSNKEIQKKSVSNRAKMVI